MYDIGLRWKDIDSSNNRIFFRIVNRKRICTDASIVNGKAVFETASQVFEEGIKNGDYVKVLKLNKMQKVWKLTPQSQLFLRC